MSFSLSAQLSPPPNDRDAVADAILRCVCGLDTADNELFRSAFTADAVFDLNGKLLHGIDEINAGCFDNVSKLDTTHLTSNVRTTFSPDGRTAQTTAHGVAHHYPAGKGLSMENNGNTQRFVVGSLYSIDLVKEDGDSSSGQGPLWKAKVWRLKSIWTQGDWSVMGALPRKDLDKKDEDCTG
ncbi:hypothetical protein NLG97_g8873 [Lecanicillium saksenae]|uniref:Uncharacterized protein n=1 Tax=Lecanicillium saksenae TaxID=468837 RepID=A0ACC1QHV0_9HYPO|nr:hypothetical protein NLG97_g8873 [Lecanicillium saksenae]